MLTDSIARMIEEMLNQSNGILELQRNEMAASRPLWPLMA